MYVPRPKNRCTESRSVHDAPTQRIHPMFSHLPYSFPHHPISQQMRGPQMRVPQMPWFSPHSPFVPPQVAQVQQVPQAPIPQHFETPRVSERPPLDELEDIEPDHQFTDFLLSRGISEEVVNDIAAGIDYHHSFLNSLCDFVNQRREVLEEEKYYNERMKAHEDAKRSHQMIEQHLNYLNKTYKWSGE
ncbi:hypothetical protein P9112_008394 [Eukaryota sp. TZLM1-RC]